MKQYAFLIFFSIIFGIHLLVNLYIYVRGLQSLELHPQYKLTFRIVMLFLTISYPLGRFLEKVWIGPVSDVFHWSGALWFAGMLYVVMILLVFDVTRLCNGLFHFLPSNGSPQWLSLKFNAFLIAFIFAVSVMLGGFLNAWHPKITQLSLTIHKSGGARQKLRIVAASDIHMGTIIAKRKSNKLVRTINQLHPDIVLFAGDILDEDVQPVIRQNLGECLRQLKAPLGVYAVTGNHEYIGGIDRSADYLTSHGIQLLRDSVVLIDSSFYIVGREDRDKSRFTQLPRKEVTDLLSNLDHNRPIIMLDHQPYELTEKAAAGVDVQLSGHTHHGQLWPFGYLTQKIFEVSRGYKLKGNMHVYVSAGFGTWGPPVRTGNRPEIIVLDLTFDGQSE